MTNPASGAVGSQAAVGLFVLIPMLSEDNRHICLPSINFHSALSYFCNYVLMRSHSPVIRGQYTYLSSFYSFNLFSFPSYQWTIHIYLPLIHFHNLETWCPSGPFRFSQSRQASWNRHLLAVDFWFQILHYKSLHATICWTFFKRKNCYLWFQTLHSKSFHPTICWTHLGENLNCRQRS